MKIVAAFILLAIMLCLPTFASGAEPQASYEDLPVGYLSVEAVKTVLAKALSPKGRYVILAGTGMVRIFDGKDKMETAKLALEELKNSPAIVSMEVTVKTGMHRVTRQQYPSEQPIHSYEIPIPRNYDPPRIVEHPGGDVSIVPGLPRNFKTKNLEPGTIVNVSPTGFATLDPEVRMSETSVEGGVTRKLIGLCAAGKSLAMTVLPRVADPAALRDWALSQGVITSSEPEWTAAGTELLMTPDISTGILSLHLVPQIVTYPADRTKPVRRFPFSACATTVFIDRGKSTTIEELPHADSEFYSLFFEGKPSKGDVLTFISLAAGVQYIGVIGK